MAREGKRDTLLIVSPRHHRALAALATADGWTVAAAAQADVQAALAEGVRIALVDGRGVEDGGVAAGEALGGFVAATGGALVVLLDRPDAALLDAHFAAGATHFLAPVPDDEALRQTLRFADRHARRAGGRGGDERRRPTTRIAEAEGWIAERLAAGAHVGVVMIALSRLDILNAARGRATGDALIAAARVRVQAIVAELLAADGVVIAPGGGELVVLAAAEPARLDTLAMRLDAVLAQPLAIGERRVVLGSRWGMAESGAGDDAARLLRRAGEALAAAKLGDSGMVRISGPQGAMPLDALAVDLHHAIERDEIDILFQPQATMDGGRVTGVEALARWHHGRLGSLGADALFAAAERADLGLALSEHIQALVLARVAAWAGPLADLRVALNVTAADLARPGFAASFLDRVAASGVAARRLTVEITETGAIRDLSAAAGVLRAIRAAGARVALDDFGTGYSSLAYLAALPLDYLKLDKALAVGTAAHPADNRGVVRAVMALARALDLPVIAEGVETEAQRALLATEGCALFQGFLLAPPMDEAALLQMMETHR